MHGPFDHPINGLYAFLTYLVYGTKEGFATILGGLKLIEILQYSILTQAYRYVSSGCYAALFSLHLRVKAVLTLHFMPKNRHNEKQKFDVNREPMSETSKLTIKCVGLQRRWWLPLDALR